MSSRMDENPKKIIKLNVGGQIFETTLTTLMMAEPGSMLANMFANENPAIIDENGAYYLDRSPKYFEVVLNYLRTGQVFLEANVNLEGVIAEAKYFGLDEMLNIMREKMSGKSEFIKIDIKGTIFFTTKSNLLTCPMMTLNDMLRMEDENPWANFPENLQPVLKILRLGEAVYEVLKSSFISAFI